MLLNGSGLVVVSAEWLYGWTDRSTSQWFRWEEEEHRRGSASELHSKWELSGLWRTCGISRGTGDWLRICSVGNGVS